MKARLCALLLIALVSLLANDAGHGSAAPAPPSCADLGSTFEQATTGQTEYAFSTPGHVVEAQGIAWSGIEGEALALLGSAPGCWKGGLVDGPYDDASVYECNRTHCPSEGCPSPCLAYHTTACMAPESSAGLVIESFECAHYGDGISRELDSGDLVLRRVRLHDLNDDAIEDDYGLSNTRVFGALIDGAHVAFGDRQRSSQNNDATGSEWEVRDSLIRVRANANPYKQRPGHGGIWKGDTNPSHQHRYRITNNVFVAQGLKQGGLLFPVAGYVDECAGNTLLWAGPLTGSGGWEEALADQSDFADALSEGERLAALNAAFPDCFRVALKPADQTEAEFLDSPLAELAGTSWNQRVAEWGGANSAPHVVITAPADGTLVGAGEAVVFAASADDSEDGDLSAAIAWRSSRAGVLGSGASLTLTNLSVGTHVVTASVTDSGGLAHSAAVTLSVEGQGSSPIVLITAPVDGTTVAEGAALSLAATADDAEDGDLSAAIAWSSSLAGPLGSGASLMLTNLSVGTHVVTASATDSAALTGSASVTLTVDAKPVVTISAPQNNFTVTAGSPITFVGSASDGEDGVLSANVVWTSNKEGVLGSGASLTTSLRVRGTHLVTASVTDSHGSVGQAQLQIRVKR